jgi:hypothetical protein
MELVQSIASSRDGMRLGGMAACMVCLFISSLASTASAALPDVKAQVQLNYGKLPLSFEANQGQADAQVKFLSRGQGYTLFLTPTEAVLSLTKTQTQAEASSLGRFSSLSPSNVKFLPLTSPNRKFSSSTPPNRKFSSSIPPNTKFSPSSPSNTKFSPSRRAVIEAVLRVQFIGANPSPRIVGKETLPGRVNYLSGKDSGQWLTGVTTYAKVAYEGIYPGVDMVYYGNQGKLEYDFVVSPGADPRQVKLAFRGVDKIDISPAGELILRAANEELRMNKPVIYQEIGGVRKPIDGGYVLMGEQEVGFQVAAYDTSRPLVIDPVLVYSTYLGGSGLDIGQGIAVDQQGRAYVTGQTSSTDFPTENALQADIGSNLDAFVVQITADGSALGYATYLGGRLSGEGLGNAADGGFSIAVDQQGQAAVAGITFSSDFPTENALQPTYGGGGDAFIAQLTADGAALRYATYLGGSGLDVGFGIAMDQQGQVSVTGETSSSNFPVENALQPTYRGGGDAFIAQLTADGTALRYATYLGGSEFERGWGIAVDQQGQVSVSGQTTSSDFPVENAIQPVIGGASDAFVAQLMADGAALNYATYLGGSEGDFGFGIAVDQQGQVFVTGQTGSSDFPVENALQPTLGGEQDAFVAQFTADGEALRYATYLGGSRRDQGFSIALDQQGQAFVTGYTYSSDFPTENALQPTLGGEQDAFVAQFTLDGSSLEYSTYLGGSGNDQGFSIALDQQGQVYVTGETRSNDFPTMNALQPAFGGSFPNDAFVAKIRNGNQPSSQ